MIWINGVIDKGSFSAYPESGDYGLIYEVLRIIEGTPVFFNEHLIRFFNSVRFTNVNLGYNIDDLLKACFDVIVANNVVEGNIRIQADLAHFSVKIGMVPHKYPETSDFQNGVDVELADLQRTNPEIKIWNKSVRMASDSIIREKNIYEVILTSPEGFILEGSRSNIFGLKKGILITPPANSVLPGITRQVVIEIAKDHNIPVEENHIHKAKLTDYQSFFLTGTSPGILPIRSIGSDRFNCSTIQCNILRNSYDDCVKESILKTRARYKKL